MTFPEQRGLPEGVLEPRLSSASYEFAGDRDASMAVDSIEISGPYEGERPDATPSRQRIFTCEAVGSLAEDEACASDILAALARRAFRRPVTGEDVEALLRFYRSGQADGGFDRGIQRALRALIVDPEFLFRIEREPAGVAAGAAYPVTDVELASRLSFFLWSSLPDDELLALAEAGRLSDPETLRGQVGRMLGDPRSAAFVENFAGQWLYLRNLPGVKPDPDAYPEFDDNLREGVPHRNGAVHRQSAPRGSQRGRAADGRLYLPPTSVWPSTTGWLGCMATTSRRVPLAGGLRSGLLGHGSILTATSYPNRTSPTLRGKWVLENLLGAPPPAPPPDVPDLEESDAASPRSVRGASGGPSRQPGLRQLPCTDGSAGSRAGTVRRHRRHSHP